MCMSAPKPPKVEPVKLPEPVKAIEPPKPPARPPAPESTATYLASPTGTKVAPTAARSSSYESLRIRPTRQKSYMGLNIPNA